MQQYNFLRNGARTFMVKRGTTLLLTGDFYPYIAEFNPELIEVKDNKIKFFRRCIVVADVINFQKKECKNVYQIIQDKMNVDVEFGTPAGNAKILKMCQKKKYPKVACTSDEPLVHKGKQLIKTNNENMFYEMDKKEYFRLITPIYKPKSKNKHVY